MTPWVTQLGRRGWLVIGGREGRSTARTPARTLQRCGPSESPTRLTRAQPDRCRDGHRHRRQEAAARGTCWGGSVGWRRGEGGPGDGPRGRAGQKRGRPIHPPRWNGPPAISLSCPSLKAWTADGGHSSNLAAADETDGRVSGGACVQAKKTTMQEDAMIQLGMRPGPRTFTMQVWSRWRTPGWRACFCSRSNRKPLTPPGCTGCEQDREHWTVVERRMYNSQNQIHGAGHATAFMRR